MAILLFTVKPYISIYGRRRLGMQLITSSCDLFYKLGKTDGNLIKQNKVPAFVIDSHKCTVLITMIFALRDCKNNQMLSAMS